MSIRLTILSEIEKIAATQDRQLGTLTDTLPLAKSGFDSLCFAVLVAQLDDILGIDPFSSSDNIEFPVTIGDFIKLYEYAAKKAA